MKAYRPRAQYPRKYADYARDYGVHIAEIDRWVLRGKQAGKLPPLDDRGAMVAWWADCMGTVVPTGRFAANSNGNGEARDFSKVRGLTMQQNVEALRVTLAINKRLLDEALCTQDENTVGLRQRNYERCFNLLRLSETSLLEHQRRLGQLIERDKVVDDATKVVETLRLMRERMGRDILVALEKRCGRRMRRIVAHLREKLDDSIEEVRRGEEQIFARGFKL
jgi:hypothetical protein